MTLNEAIHKVLRTSSDAPFALYQLSVEEITAKINEQQLYVRKDGTPIPTHQIIARVRAYPDQFSYHSEDNTIRLLDPFNVSLLTKEYHTILQDIKKQIWSGGGLEQEITLGILASLMLDNQLFKSIEKTIHEDQVADYLQLLEQVKSSFKFETVEHRAWRYLSQSIETTGMRLALSKLASIDFEKIKSPKGFYEKKALIQAIDNIIYHRSNYTIATPKLEANTIRSQIAKYQIPNDLRNANLDILSGVNLSLEELDLDKTIRTIYDPVGGYGTLINHIIRQDVELFDKIEMAPERMVNRQLDLRKIGYKIVVQEIQEELLFNAYFLSVIHQNAPISFHQGDSTKDIPVKKASVDIIVADIPVGGKKHDERLEIQLVEQSLNLLKPKGIAALLLSEQFFFAESKSYKETRKRLVSEDLIESIITFKSKDNRERQSFGHKVLLVINTAKEKYQKGKVAFWTATELSPQEQVNSFEADPFNVKRTSTPVSINNTTIVKQKYTLNPKRYLTDIDAIEEHLEYITSLKECFIKTKFPKSTKEEIYHTISIKDLDKDEKIAYIDLTYELLPRNTKSGHLIEEDALLMASIGNRLRPTLFKYEGKPLAATSTVFVRKIDTTKVLPEYLCIELNKYYVFLQVEAYSKGSAMPRLSVSDLANLKISLPSIKKQKEVIEKWKERKQPNLTNSKAPHKDNLLPSLKHTVSQYLSSFNTHLKSLEHALNRSSESGNTFDWNTRTSPNPNNPTTVRHTFDKVVSESESISTSFDTVKKIIAFEEKNLNKETSNIKSFIQKTVKAQLREKDRVLFNISHDESFAKKDFEVEYDKAQFKVLLTNFIENSIKHGFAKMKEGRKITITLTPLVTEQKIQVDLNNNGESLRIPFEEYIKPFRTSNKETGTGIGGYLMHKIVLNHKGTLRHIPTGFNGVLFRITLPYQINQ